MKRTLIIVLVLTVVALGLAVAAPGPTAGRSRQGTAKETPKVPPAVAKAVKANCPGAVVDKMDVEKEAGIALYDFEFKAGRGEIEVAEDGTVMDIATIVAFKDIPKPAADAILKAAAGAKIQKVEKSEIRAEINKAGERGTIVKLAAPKYVYEAELVQGEKQGEVQVAPDGTIVEGPKWGEEEEEEEEETEEAGELKAAAGVDLKILPPAVLGAFQKAYPKAEIKGASKETEKGVTYYEIESVDGKMNRDLLYAADGKVVEVEEAVAPGALPAAVLKALEKAYPGYQILKAEDLLKDGQKLFELQIQVNGKKTGVTIDPSGKIIQ